MKLLLLACLVATQGIAVTAAACPDCASARAVRASVLDERFWPQLFTLALPIVAIGVLACLLYRIGMNRT